MKLLGNLRDFGTSLLSKMKSLNRRIIGSGSTQYKAFLTCGLLLLINLLNYIDRYTMSPLLTDIREYFSVDYSATGYLPTVFICVYMVFAPVFGYLGDRYSRKMLISIGIVVWSGSVIACTFVPRNAYWGFVLLRGVVGIGEASYATIAPTLIADFFVGYTRSRVLALFYFGIPVGSGLGTVLGPLLANALGSWKWGLRVSPIVGLVSAMLFLFTFDPPRGLAEGKPDSTASTSTWAWLTDILEICRVKTFILTTLGFAGVSFCVGSLTWWSPTYILYAQRANNIEFTESQAGTAFGVITALGGLVGTLLGSFLAQVWRKWDKKSDCLVCAISLLIAAPISFLGLTLLKISLIPAYVVVFLAVTLLCFNWAVNPDILLSVIPPTHRATASGFQTMIGHVLGDAISPYILSEIAEKVRGLDESEAGYYESFRSALYAASFASLLAAVCYFAASFFAVNDLVSVDNEAKDSVELASRNHAPTTLSVIEMETNPQSNKLMIRL